MRRKSREGFPFCSSVIFLTIIAAILYCIGAKINNRISECSWWQRKTWIIMIETMIYCPKARLQTWIFAGVIIRETLRVILSSKAPWETIVQPLANPIELIRIVGIGAIIHRKQVAIGRECHIIGITCTTSENQSLCHYRSHIIW